MPRWDRIPPDVRTDYLGQFTRRDADRIAKGLEDAGIVWWWKEPGFLSSLWEVGVRLFVDRTRIDEAREIVRATTQTRPRRKGPQIPSDGTP
ncbi:MAG: hypothetical protein ACM3OO_14395 [Planctomycetaceae bacterium]